MATLNLGRIKPVFRGAYAGGTAYVVDDIVTSGNETFICIQASTGNATSNASYWTKLAAKGTDGTDVGTTITTQGDILYRDGSGLQRLAKPASDMYLKNTSAGALSWAALSSDYVKVASGTITDTTNWDFAASNFDGSTYNTFDIHLEPQTHSGNHGGNGELRFLMNGTPLGSGTTSSTGIEMNSSSSSVNGKHNDGGDSGLFLGDGTRPERGFLRATFKGLNRGTEKAGFFNYVRCNHDGDTRLKWNIGNIYTKDTTATTNGIRFQFNTNMTGDYIIYGRK